MTKQLTKQTIGVGVAGTGFIGPRTCRRSAPQRDPGAGAWPKTHRKMAQQKAAELGIPRVMARFDDMLADPDIDVVHLATPNHAASSACQSRAAGWQACRLRKTAGDDIRRIGGTGQTGSGEEAGQRGQLQHPHVSDGTAGAQHGAERRTGRPVHPAGFLFAGLAALPDRLELAAGTRPGRHAAGCGRHRLALARPDDLHHRLACGRSLCRFQDLPSRHARNLPNRSKPLPAKCCSPPITSTSRSTPKTTPPSCCIMKTACAAC